MTLAKVTNDLIFKSNDLFQSSSFLIFKSNCLYWWFPYSEILSFLGLHFFLFSFTLSSYFLSPTVCWGTILGSGGTGMYHILVEEGGNKKYGNEYKVSYWIMMRLWRWPVSQYGPLFSLPTPLTISLVLLSGSSAWYSQGDMSVLCVFCMIL